MQSFREQSNYHGSQQSYPPEAHGPSRIEEFSPRQQAQMFQGSYGGRRAGAGTPTSVTPGENSSLQNYQAYRKESGEFYYLGNKEGTAPGSPAPQRRPSGPVQSYGPPQGSNSSGTTGFGSHYGREGHPSQFSGQHSTTASISQYSQDFPGSFSPGGGQYPSHVPAQQLRQQLYQSHHPIAQSANTSATAAASHLQQLQRSAAISSSVGYPLRMGQYGQHYQSTAGSATSYPPQRFGQSGANYEGYSPGGTSSPYESHLSGSYGTQQQGFSSYSQHLKNFETTKIPQGGSQAQQQQNPHVMQFTNSPKLLTQSQAGQFNQSEVPVRSPMQFQQNFSPISNPSPAASVAQSPSCSSTPSPLMTSGENLQSVCSQGSVQHASRNRILPMMPQLSPNTQIGNYKGFGVEGQPDKRLTDPGLSSLSALSSQVANLPNTVQHMLLSDALAPNKKGSKRTSRKTDSCANSETSSQAEEQLKSPMTESLDGSCASSTGDPGERVRQLSGQSTSSEAGYKGPPSEKPASPVQSWQNEPSEKPVDQEPDTVPEPAELFQEVPKSSEKSVGVIVSMETMTNRLEKVADDSPQPVDVDSEVVQVESNLPKTTEENENNCSNNQNGESSACESVSAPTINVSQTESARSPVGAGFGAKETPTSTKSTTSVPQNTKNSDGGSFGAQGDRKPGRNEKFPSLLQEVLQGHHQQEGRYARSTQEHPPGMASPEAVLRSNVLTSQSNEQPNRNMLGKNSASHLEASHWSQWERKSTSESKPINVDFPAGRKFEADVPVSTHEPSSGLSERRSVICDISPLRQIVREPSSSHHLGTAQERPSDGRSGQSVILPSGMLALEKANCLGGIAKVEEESPKVHRKRAGEHCMPYSTKDSVRGSASPRAMAYDLNQEYSSHNSLPTPKRGAGRVGSRGRSSAQTQDHGEKLKISPGRSRGPTDLSHINPTVSMSERASREALYSAFFQNTDSSTLGYHTNSRSSSYGEPHPSFTSSLHYKRQMYQQEEYKEWLGSSAQAILSASQHRQEMQRKSPRQEPFHVRSPARNESEGLGYNQPSSFHEHIDFSRQLRMNEGTPSNMSVEMKRNSQKTPPGESASWHLAHQASQAKKVGSTVLGNQKPFGPNREPETHGSRSGDSAELSQQGSVHRSAGSEESSHHNPLIMRRRVRSFISPIPSKRQFPDDKGRSAASSKDGSEKIGHLLSPTDADTGFSAMTEEPTKSISEQRSPTAVSLSSPTKTKILPPRKGRGLKLEAIVQKITSPNVRRISAPCTSESSAEPVTLDDILSLKGKGPDVVSGPIPEATERTPSILPSIPCNDEMKVKVLPPKGGDTWTVHEDKQIKKEIDEQPLDDKELPPSSSIIESSSNHFNDTREDSPAFEPKCSLQQVQQCDLGDQETLPGVPCPVTPKQDAVLPPKGYFPSGKKKGRPVGSVNKQKKQLQQQQQQAQQQPQVQQQQQAAPQQPQVLQQQQVAPQQPQEQEQPLPVITVSVPTPSLPAPPPPEIPPVAEQVFESESKPKRRRRERRKASGTTTRRRRGRQVAPIVVPIEPEIKLKYASQTVDKTETKAKSFYPYIHVSNKEELGLSCVIINAEDEEQRWRKLTSVRKGQRSTSPQPTESKALPASSFMVQGPVVTESASLGPLVCCFCGKWANYKNLGDLFGPFYTQEYASTLSKNPPPKKTVETPKKVKVRHKDGSDGSKSDSEEEEEPQQAREQRSLPAHPRFKRRNRSGDGSSRLAVPSCRKTTDSCELNPLDSSGTSTADGVSDQGFQIPQLPLDMNEFWMHEGCVLWANGVYLVCGRLYGLQEALDIAREMTCAHCQEQGATLGCYNKGCACCYHYPCAMDSECLLSEENFSVRCPKHKMKTFKGLSAEQPEQS